MELAATERTPLTRAHLYRTPDDSTRRDANAVPWLAANIQENILAAVVPFAAAALPMKIPAATPKDCVIRNDSGYFLAPFIDAFGLPVGPARR